MAGGFRISYWKNTIRFKAACKEEEELGAWLQGFSRAVTSGDDCSDLERARSRKSILPRLRCTKWEIYNHRLSQALLDGVQFREFILKYSKKCLVFLLCSHDVSMKVGGHASDI